MGKAKMATGDSVSIILGKLANQAYVDQLTNQIYQSNSLYNQLANTGSGSLAPGSIVSASSSNVFSFSGGLNHSFNALYNQGLIVAPKAEVSIRMSEEDVLERINGD